jgi:hypothetical protein
MGWYGKSRLVETYLLTIVLGPIFDKHVDVDITKRPFKGSVMVVNEQSWDGFMEKVQTDMYIKERIWDLEKTKFIPFRTLAPFR